MLLDAGWLVVVLSDTLQERPAVATVVDLATGTRSDLTAARTPPTMNGGTWALQGGVLVHATVGADGAYCLARRDLGAPAAPRPRGARARRHGFTNARITPAGLAVMAFDDQRPSCRTLGTLADGDAHRRCPASPTARAGSWSLTEHRCGLVGGPAPQRARRGRGPRALRRHRPRPRSGDLGQPDLVRRRDVLRPRPAGPRRAGPPAALDRRRRLRGGLREQGAARPSCPRRAAAATGSPSRRSPRAATSRSRRRWAERLVSRGDVLRLPRRGAGLLRRPRDGQHQVVLGEAQAGLRRGASRRRWSRCAPS